MPSKRKPRTATRSRSSRGPGRRHESDGEQLGATTVAAVSPALPFPVVGIGASAGGLEAISQLLRVLPPETGMAYVVVTHLSPTRASQMAEILGRETPMPVMEVQDEPRVQPNHVYVIPPNRSMVIEGGSLALYPRQDSHLPNRAVDQFLQSLAADQRHSSIAVILSGTVDDGSLGVEDIKAQGGITLAQDDTAQHDDMPRNAAATGCVDFVGSPQRIAEELTAISRHSYVSGERAATAEPPEIARDQASLGRVLQSLRATSGVDFSHYKRNTLSRRIARRMVLHRVEALAEYATMVEGDRTETEALYRDILINVTSFFRDPEAFDTLKRKVFPALLRDRPRQDPVRMWVVGCSTGEEAYSLAIALAEYGDAVGRAIPVQIFATDLNAAGIEKARAGLYSRSIAEHVSPERLRRFFTQADGGYRIAKSIRDMCIFAQHNGLTDPPFSQIDLISCRNLLIYLEPQLQQKLMPVLHYALRPHGFLWLGGSETIGTFRDYFEVEDAKQKLYSRKAHPARLGGAVPASAPPGNGRSANGRKRGTVELVATGVDAQRKADRILLNRYSPAGALVNGDLDILQFRGDSGRFLTPSPGKASLNLLKMLRDGLLVPVRNTMAKARKSGVAVRHAGARMRTHGTSVHVAVEVIPVRGTSPREDCYLVLFDDTPEARPSAKAKPARAKRSGATRDREMAELAQELETTKDHLQSVIEQQEAANEELQSANEEVQSTNEELQSINEELETSKEEIQSSNEELATVNDELNTRNLELTQSNNDLQNLISSVQMAIVMLGPDLRIRRFTPTAERMLNLIETDVGRPITDIKLNVEVPDLQSLLGTVIDTVTPAEREGRDTTGCWYSVRIRPYRTADNKIDGAVLMFVDIDSLKRGELAVRESEGRFRLLADSAPVLIWVTGPRGNEFVNRAYLDFLGVGESDVLEMRWAAHVHPEDRDAYVAAYYAAVRRDEPFQAQARFRRADNVYRWMMSVGVPRADGASRPSGGYVGSTFDITELRTAEEGLRSADERKNEFLAMLAHELRNPLAPLQNAVELLRTPNADRATLEWARDLLERQVRYLSRMVDDLIDVSRVTRGAIQLRTVPTNLNDALRRTVQDVRFTTEERQQVVTLDLPKEPLIGTFDPIRLDQIFGNLLRNASKFGGTRANIAIVASASHTAAGALAVVRVVDDGPGIPANLLPRIFDLFTQGDTTLDRQHGGLGIGLTLVRSLVRLHGGTVDALSAGPGSGAEFVVTLPLTGVVQP